MALIMAYQLCVMEARHLFNILCLLGLFLFHSIHFNKDGSRGASLGLIYRPKLMWNQYYSASVKVPIVRQHKHGTMVIALPFAAAVSLPDYFALCCDVHSNPGPICRQHTHDERNSIPVRISGREVRNEMAFRQQKYFQTCSVCIQTIIQILYGQLTITMREPYQCKSQ
jgi:hypothetical protein